MTDEARGEMPHHWRTGDGWLAVLVCLLLVEAVFAGLSRPCMSAFSVDGVASFLGLVNLFAIPEAISMYAGTPAFLFAASPALFAVVHARRMLSIGIVVALACAIEVFWSVHVPYVAIALGILVGGALVGCAVHALHRVNVLVIPGALLTAIAIAALVFSHGAYRQPDCWAWTP